MSYTPTQQRPSYSPGSSPLLDEVRIVMRLGHISRRTEDSHLHYVSDFIRYQHFGEGAYEENEEEIQELLEEKDQILSL